MARRVLFCGDAVAATGFAKATHNYCAGMIKAGFDPHVLAINYTGDPHGHPFKAYTCFPGGDYFGCGRIKNLALQLRPDVIVIQQDPWNFPFYQAELDGISIPVVGVVAIDSKNCQGNLLNWLTTAIFWTKFAEEQAQLGGYKGTSTVIPLGVDQKIYHQKDKAQLKVEILHPIFEKYSLPKDSFVVGTVGRNQPRKRFDLMIQYFSEWVHTYAVDDAVLWLHSAPTGDDAYDLKKLAEYYDVKGRVLVPDPNPVYGVTEEMMSRIYNMLDVFMTTTLGEGMGLPPLEAMACGTPCLLPRWSALAEWAPPVARMIECTAYEVQPSINTVGGVMDRVQAVAALDFLYRNPSERIVMRDAGIRLASEPKFRWDAIGVEFVKVLEDVLNPAAKEEPIMEFEELI